MGLPESIALDIKERWHHDILAAADQFPPSDFPDQYRFIGGPTFTAGPRGTLATFGPLSDKVEVERVKVPKLVPSSF